MTKHSDDHPVHVEVDEARGAESPGVVRYVLIISLALVIVAFLAIYLLR